MTGSLTQVEYAAYIGKTKQYVNKLVRQGRIPVGPDGRIDPIAADAALRRVADPARSLAAPAPAPADDDDGYAPAAREPAGGDGTLSFSRARTATEAYRAKLAKLEYERQMDAYRPKAEVVESMVAAGRRIRQALDAIPNLAEEIVGMVAAGHDTHSLRTFLRGKVRALEQVIADSLTAEAEADDDA